MNELQQHCRTARMVAAIRNHPRLGRGTCSVVDETMSDFALSRALLEEDIQTAAQAIAWAWQVEAAFEEHMRAASNFDGWEP